LMLWSWKALREFISTWISKIWRLSICQEEEVGHKIQLVSLSAKLSPLTKPFKKECSDISNHSWTKFKS
jgi:hypothetical protein